MKSVRIQKLVDCDSPMSEPAARDALDAYLAEPRMLPELRLWITSLGVMTGLIEHHQIEARRLAQKLRSPSDK